MKYLTYLLGEPGVGKSALMAAMVNGNTGAARDRPFAHALLPNGWCHLGRLGAAHPGTDTLPHNIQPVVLSVLRDPTLWPHQLVLAEGDRLANAGFFDALGRSGWRLDLWFLTAPAIVAAARRHARASHQDATWLRGRATKVANLWQLYGANLLPAVNVVARQLDATRPVADLAAEVRACLPS